MGRYIKEFAVTRKAPYLGMPPGCVICKDVAELPADVEAIWLQKKAKNVEQLVKLKQLRRIQCELQEDWLPVFSQIRGLRCLKLRLPKSAELPTFACLTNLRTLILSCSRHQKNLEFLNGMDWLHSLCVSEPMGIESLDPIASLTGLRELYVDGQISGVPVVDSLAPLNNLTELRYAVLLLKVATKCEALAPLHDLKRLEFLHLSTRFEPADYDGLLAALPRLKEIHFNGGKRWPPENSIDWTTGSKKET